jgi:NADH:ubiquinone oxidoreductase subunit 2 (subunit N)
MWLFIVIYLASPDAGQFTWVMMIFAVLSMTFGNLSALVQTDLKRLLGIFPQGFIDFAKEAVAAVI